MKTPQRSYRQEAPRQKSRGGMLLGLFLGLVIGVLIAFGVVWYLNKAKLPFMDKYEGAPPSVNRPAGNGQAVPGGVPATPVPLPLPGKPGDKVTEKPRFDFYGILEGKQPANQAPVDAKPAPTPAIAASPAPVAIPAVTKPAESVFLQVGAFQKAADADKLKAKLALLGMEANVQEVDLPEKGVMHRVRVGPFRSPDEANKARTQLSQDGVQAAVVKP